MQVTKAQAYEKIKGLVERFSEHVEAYKRNSYNEHQTRVDYINPFFKALGWDMDNRQGHAEAYREVIHEDKVKVGGATKAPDYGFTLYGQRKFFVDAKKPSVNIKGDIAPAYQVRRYGWSAKVPISIITDFEEFSIYDCTKKPKLKDKASVSRIKYLTYDQFLEEFDFFWDIFAKENLPKGRFDKYVQSDTAKKGTATVDDEFLKSIEEWRRYLATTIALRNKSLNEDEVNYAVQKTIDRIIFLRMCEDRGVEQYGELKKAAAKGNVYENLFRLYHIADDKYNSGLFDFKEDKITPALTIDNKVLKIIIKELYYPNCEYEFSVMPADILGSVYERFLGKTIRLTAAHHAKIEEKPEVRKAGGVYYTPKYVVDYIVQNTVGKLIEGKTPKQVEKIKICDPACGSGSFLIGAYQHLLDWHRNYYLPEFKRLSVIASENPNRKIGVKAQKDRKKLPLTPDGNLTSAEKKRILLNNIFGVDIDTQAVEVTKLNLLLKALEGETTSSIDAEMNFGNRILPNLNQNIKCGNSLIGPNFYDDQLDLFSEQMKKINAFDWKKGFSEVFKWDEGFDVVIGNPPYRTLQLGKKQKSEEDTVVNYYERKYCNSAVYKVNLYAIFIERSLDLINSKGLFSFIVPNSLYTAHFYGDLRELMLNVGSFRVIADLRYKVFDEAEIGGNAVFIYAKNKKDDVNIISANTKEDFLNPTVQKGSNKGFRNHEGNIIISNVGLSKINLKIAKVPTKQFGEIAIMYQGIITGDNKKYLASKKMSYQWKKVLRGRDINKYTTTYDEIYVLYDPDKLWSNTKLEMFDVDSKIISRQTSDKLIATIDNERYFSIDSTHVIHLKEPIFDLRYLLAVYNSRLINFLYQARVKESGRVFAQVKTVNVKPLPIRIINNKEEGEKSTHDQIVQLVDKLLKLNKQLQATKLETQRQQIQRTIDHTERKIDELVYGLYGLSKKEIEIIENES